MATAALYGLLCPSCKFLSKGCPPEQLRALSPVPHLLKSCTTLTREESTTIDGFINTLSEQINDLHAQIRHLSLVQEALWHNRADHENRLLPINRIPDELLVEIFHLSMPMNPLVVDLEPPLALSQVCRRWRNIMTSDARFWNVIDVEQMCGPLIDLLVARSGDSPLTIVDGQFGSTLRSIFQQAHRFRAMYVRPETLKALLTSGKELPMLRVLYCRAIYDYLPQFSSLPFAQITHLAAGKSSIQGVFAEFPNLVSLDIEHRLDGDVIPEPLVHPRLQFLKLKFHEMSSPAPTFQKFDLPSLKSLIMIKLGFLSWIPTAAIQHIIASSHSLDTLILHTTFPEETANFMKLLEDLPDLRNLHIRDDHYGGTQYEVMYMLGFVRQIVERLSSRPSFLPKLKFLTLEPGQGFKVEGMFELKSQRSLIEEEQPFNWLKLPGSPGDCALRAGAL